MSGQRRRQQGPVRTERAAGLLQPIRAEPAFRLAGLRAGARHHPRSRPERNPPFRVKACPLRNGLAERVDYPSGSASLRRSSSTLWGSVRGREPHFRHRRGFGGRSWRSARACRLDVSATRRRAGRQPDTAHSIWAGGHTRSGTNGRKARHGTKPGTRSTGPAPTPDHEPDAIGQASEGTLDFDP